MFLLIACVYNGKCYKAGDKVTEGCYTKQCFYDKEKRATYMNIVDGGILKYKACCTVYGIIFIVFPVLLNDKVLKNINS